MAMAINTVLGFEKAVSIYLNNALASSFNLPWSFSRTSFRGSPSFGKGKNTPSNSLTFNFNPFSLSELVKTTVAKQAIKKK
jgi:hypothetical protein